MSEYGKHIKDKLVILLDLCYVINKPKRKEITEYKVFENDGKKSDIIKLWKKWKKSEVLL